MKTERLELDKISAVKIKWMESMIPHYAIAILTSNNADLKNPEVKKLAEEIV